MSAVAAVVFLSEHGRYAYASTMSNTIKNVVFFGQVVGVKDRGSNVFNPTGIDGLLKRLDFGNTPETAIDPSLLSNLNSQTFEMPMMCHALFVNCPDEATRGWMLIDGVFLDQEAYVNWRDNLMEKGFPPRSPEELAEDKRIAEEDRRRVEAEAKLLEAEQKFQEAEAIRLANLRPKKMGKIAIARVYDLDNYCVALIELDLNNTTVKDIRRLIAKANGVEAGGRPLASTNYFTAQGLKDLTDKNKGKYSMTVTVRHQLASVVMDKGFGQPQVRVPSNTRSTLADNVRLADMKGEVMVYFYNGIPSSAFSWKDFLIGELFATLLGEGGNYL
jgi:hypothetical protein